MEEVKMKRCPKCGRLLPISQFWKANNRPDGAFWCCKECGVEYTRRSEEKKKEKRIQEKKETKRKRYSGFTLEDLIEELKARGCTGFVSYKEESRKEMIIDGKEGVFSYVETKEIEF